MESGRARRILAGRTGIDGQDATGLHQDLRLPDECLRFERMADVLAPLGYAPTETPEDADLVMLNTCHIREKAAEKVYSELGRLRASEGKRRAAKAAMSDRGRGLRCAGRRRGDPRAGQPAVDIVVGPQAYHRLPEMLAAERARRPAVRRNRLSARKKVRPSAAHADEPRAASALPDGAGRLRQVLHFLRRALHARRGVFAARRRDRGRGAAACRRRRARDHAARPERQRLSRRGPDGETWPRRACSNGLPTCGSSGCATRPAIRAT